MTDGAEQTDKSGFRARVLNHPWTVQIPQRFQSIQVEKECGEAVGTAFLYIAAHGCAQADFSTFLSWFFVLCLKGK